MHEITKGCYSNKHSPVSPFFFPQKVIPSSCTIYLKVVGAVILKKILTENGLSMKYIFNSENYKDYKGALL